MADALEPPSPERLEAYFALTEATSLLQHNIEQHLRRAGDLSAVQFQVLMRLAYGEHAATMTQLADGVVYSRSGLSYQADLLEKRGLIARVRSTDDERATLVTITDEGRALIECVLPGHIAVVRGLLLDLLSDDDVQRLGAIMTRVRDRIRAEPPRSAAPRGTRRRPPSAGERQL